METGRLRVVVDRSRWLRGEGSGKSYLLRPSDDRMCCLGFACLAAGHSTEEIWGAKTPLLMDLKLSADIKLPSYKSVDIGEAMSINDRVALDDPDRESALIDVLSRIGIDIEFVDGSPP